MLSDEEKEILYGFANDEDCAYCYDWDAFDYKKILPLINKLLEENQSLIQVLHFNEMFTEEVINMYYIRKNKIRERIKELENCIDNFTYRNLTDKDIRGAVIRELKSILKEE